MQQAMQKGKKSVLGMMEKNTPRIPHENKENCVYVCF